MDGQRLNLLKKIMALEFTALELNLYLDTHPNDQRALAEFNEVSQALLLAKKDYEAYYGPLLNYGFSPSHNAWRWVEEPWPWEISF
ncbi:MAG: spore coat protein [Clostridia bacterium]|nr:spore coat protein [Clostridia bacterium]